MANSRQTSIGTVAAEPEPIDLDWSTTALLIIDMQRDFMEPGGFGETLGNDVSQLARAVEPIAAVLDVARDIGLLVVHTRDRKSTRLNSSHQIISYAVFFLKKKNINTNDSRSMSRCPC